MAPDISSGLFKFSAKFPKTVPAIVFECAERNRMSSWSGIGAPATFRFFRHISWESYSRGRRGMWWLWSTI